MTLKAASKLVEYYRDQFGLSQWDVVLTCLPAEEADTYAGRIEWYIEYHSAEIFLRKHRKGDQQEQTIVHELLHLRLEGHRVKIKSYDPMYEHALNVLAEAIVSANGKP